MFKQRLLTTLVLVPLVLLLIYWGNRYVLQAVIFLLVGALCWEWTQLIPVKKLVPRLSILVVTLLLIWPCNFLQMGWLICTTVLWILIFIAILTYPTSEKYWGNRLFVSLACLIILPLFASTLSALYLLPQGKDLLLYLLFLVWATDIGAYLAGKQWGRHKLIPRVSPGKTVEGTLGGSLLALLITFLGYYYFKPINVVMWFSLAIYTIFMSMIGDLFISMLKRRCQLKDTGNIFPGHGGVLDRLDSLIAALPLFYWGLMMFSVP